MPTSVHQLRDAGMGLDAKSYKAYCTNGLGPNPLVRGCDAMRGWINVAGQRGMFDAGDLEFYDQGLADQSATLAAGAASDVGLFSAT